MTGFKSANSTMRRVKASHTVMLNQTSQNDGGSIPSIHAKSKQIEMKEINKAYQSSSKGEVNSFLNTTFSLMKSSGKKYRGKQL
jgi:hypothetical protein